MVGSSYLPDKSTELKYSTVFMFLDTADIDNMLRIGIPDKCFSAFDILVTDDANNSCRLLHKNDYIHRNSPHHFEPDIDFFGPYKDTIRFASDAQKIEPCIRKVADFDTINRESYIHYDIKKPWLTPKDMQTLYVGYREMFPEVVLEQVALSDVPLPVASKLMETIPVEKTYGIQVNPKEQKSRI